MHSEQSHSNTLPHPPFLRTARYVQSSFYTAFSGFPQAIEIVTLIPKFPLSANSCAIEVSNTRQSEFKIADDTPS